MNYCSIEDAWGSGCNSMSNQIDEYINQKNPTPKKDKINLDYEVKKSKNINKLKKIDSYDEDKEINLCDDYLLHIKSCRKCYNRMRNQFRPHLIENFQCIVDDNKDTIVLILVGISILLFFNLINNITK
jgi:pyrimidine operon attenuation protein/uracil phosphoribosyltransferase